MLRRTKVSPKVCDAATAVLRLVTMMQSKRNVGPDVGRFLVVAAVHTVSAGGAETFQLLHKRTLKKLSVGIFQKPHWCFGVSKNT